MTSSPALVLGALGAGVLIAGVGILTNPQSTREGQIVFTQWESRSTDTVDPTLGVVTIMSCESTPEGTQVRGYVVSGSGVTPVLVLPGDATGAGIGVASGFAGMSDRVPGAEPGDFLVTLPWASVTSRFAVAAPDSLGVGASGVVHGPETSCG